MQGMEREDVHGHAKLTFSGSFPGDIPPVPGGDNCPPGLPVVFFSSQWNFSVWFSSCVGEKGQRGEREKGEEGAGSQPGGAQQPGHTCPMGQRHTELVQKAACI